MAKGDDGYVLRWIIYTLASCETALYLTMLVTTFFGPMINRVIVGTGVSSDIFYATWAVSLAGLIVSICGAFGKPGIVIREGSGYKEMRTVMFLRSAWAHFWKTAILGIFLFTFYIQFSLNNGWCGSGPRTAVGTVYNGTNVVVCSSQYNRDDSSTGSDRNALTYTNLPLTYTLWLAHGVLGTVITFFVMFSFVRLWFEQSWWAVYRFKKAPKSSKD